MYVQHSHAHDERDDEVVPAIVRLDLTTEMRKTPQKCCRTYRAKFVLEVVAPVRRQRHVIKVEPNLPEPTAKPTTFLTGPSDCLFVERWLASGGVKVGDAEQARLWREDIVDAVEQGVKVWNLEAVVGALDEWEETRLTMESE